MDDTWYYQDIQTLQYNISVDIFITSTNLQIWIDVDWMIAHIIYSRTWCIEWQ